MEEEKNPEEKTTAEDASAGGPQAASQFIGLSKKPPMSEPAKPSDLRELLEKNLKWSQIIYEQNRRISRRLLWTSIATWLKWLVIIALIAWGVWYGWPLIKNLSGQYDSIMRQLQLAPGQKIDAASLDKILKMLPIDQQKQEQIKAMTK